MTSRTKVRRARSKGAKGAKGAKEAKPAKRPKASRSGLAASPDPKREQKAKGGPGAQQQEWPGSDEALRPQADHGERDYRGSGKLEGRRALITGGDSGIGRAVAIAFAREGADVAIAYYNEHEDAAETVKWVEGAGRKAVAIAGDLTDPTHCREAVAETAEALGGLDILVNNAAIHVDRSDIRDITPEQLDWTFRTNIYSFFWTTQAALDHMESGAAIINTGSVVALRGSKDLLDYSATKGAIHVFTMSLAQALAERGIRVNCVAPGPVWTPLIASTRPAQKVAEFGSDTYWERPAQPVELAPAYVFFAAADSRYCTGEVLAITGGAASR
ncbi:MAG: SDR family oxidoreductase [Longimicrobiales bacterium]